jgi:Fe2+ or Zn2+ uptake regulation protein
MLRRIGKERVMKRRNTTQRSLVLEIVKEYRGHITADEVYEKIVKDFPHVSRATVYRNLNLLCDIGDIRKVEMPGGADRYDHLCHDHYHARCVKCSRIFDVEMDFIVGLEKNIRDTHGFEISGHDIIFKGTCPECNQ